MNLYIPILAISFPTYYTHTVAEHQYLWISPKEDLSIPDDGNNV